ncbi:MAG: 30S ribosomal protein S13 [Candidatus Woesearchaeota archaeon]
MAKQESKQELRYLVRVASTDLPGEKHILYALTKITGISTSLAHAILRTANIDTTAVTGYLSQDDVEKIESILADPLKAGIPSWMLNRQHDIETGETSHLLNADLAFVTQNDVKRMMKTKSYRGLRHSWKLPLRGQRTSSNFRKSKSKSASAAKKAKKK